MSFLCQLLADLVKQKKKGGRAVSLTSLKQRANQIYSYVCLHSDDLMKA